jgi:hypothetical protein
MADKTENGKQEHAIMKVMSVRQVRKFERAQRRLILMQRRRADLIRRADLDSGIDEALEELDAIEDKIEIVVQDISAVTIQCIDHVPRSYLEDDAPDGLDWNDTASLDYIRMDKLVEMTEFVTGREAEKAAGN